MKVNYKTKLAHLLDNGDKLELEAFVEASSHDEAFALAQVRFSEIVRALSSQASIEIDKTKIEMGAHKH